MNFLPEIIMGLGAIMIVLLIAYLIKRFFINKESYKPELVISVESDEGECCGIKLSNQGSGTAVIKKVDFWDEALLDSVKTEKSIDLFFPFDKRYWLTNHIYDEERDYYLGGGDSLYFGKFKKDNVISKGINYYKLKEDFDQKVKDIRIRVEYNDVYEKPQKPLVY